MRLRLSSGIITVAVLIAVLLSMPFLSACGGDSEPATTTATTPVTTSATSPTATTEPAVVEFDVVKDAVAGYLTHISPNVKASDLYLSILEDDAPYIVSIRSANDYAAGHIPGAVNMAFGDLTTLSMDETILIYCYTGQSGSFAAAMLGVLSYDVSNLLHGMSSWTTAPSIYVSRFDPETSQGDYAVETTVNSGGSYGYPTLENTTSSDTAAILLAAAQTVSPKYITAADLHMNIAEGEDMTVIDLRAAENYAAGHVPGAINFGITALVDNLSKINPDAPVYLYCYTGHTAAQATALLQMLGYDAYSLKFGMCGWSSDPDINAGKCFNADTVEGYETE